MATTSHRQALAHLRRADPVIARVIKAVGPYRLQVRAEGTHFDALVRAIVYQQLSGKAAATIHGRLKALFGGRDPTPAELLAVPEETLRGVGLSRRAWRVASCRSTISTSSTTTRSPTRSSA